MMISMFLFSSCATFPSGEASKVRVSDSKSTSSCEFISTIDASAFDWNFVAPSVGPENAKTEILEKAALAKATDIVWLNISGSNAAANAYRCRESTASK